MKCLIFAFLISTSTYAQTAEKCKSLEKTIISINDKKRFNYSSVNKVITLSEPSGCGEANAANISDIIVQSLAKDFVRTMKVATKTPKTLDFVTAYINSTTDEKDLAIITQNAQKFCPKDKKEACARVDSAARAAMKE